MMYTKTFRLKSRDVNCYRRIRTSRFMEIMQECSIAHTTALGFGREKTLDRGLLWVVGQQHFDFYRLPQYDEEVTAATWPGRMRHLLFPRFYRLTSAATGEKLAEGCTLWVLCSAETRSAVFPEKYGVIIEEDPDEAPLPLPNLIRGAGTGMETDFMVPFSWCDLNGHMNNARYFDLLENVCPPSENWQLRSVDAEYRGEALFNRTYRMETLHQPGRTGGEKSCDGVNKQMCGDDIRMITLKDEHERILCRVRMTGTEVR